MLIRFSLAAFLTAAAAAQDRPPLPPELQKLGEYVAAYGEKASVMVAVEKYTQSVTTAETGMLRPRRIVADFAIVKTSGGWVGYRDVVQVNNEKIADRQDRLLKLLTEPGADTSELFRIANESARYNIGPVVTNMNVPTTTLFFFHPKDLHRFTFVRKGTKRIESVDTVEFAFKETTTPTLVAKRDGTDVPIEGTLWIHPADGAVVRTRLRIRGFLDTTTTNVQAAPEERPAVNPNVPTGGRPAAFIDPINQRTIQSGADIEVTYARDGVTGLWLPSKMFEQYEGPIKLGSRPPFQGVSTTRAAYSNYRQFGTGAQVIIRKEGR